MKRIRLSALLLVVALSLVACTSPGPAVKFDDGSCEHIFGAWYDVESLSCLDAGKQIRYCKFCHATQDQVTEVADDIAARKHSFTDTVVLPSESAGGYTTRVCKLCPYRVDMAAPTPPLFALLSDSGTVTAPPQGFGGVLFCDTVSRHLAYHTGTTGVNPELARRLAAALVVTDAIAAEGSAITMQSSLTVTSAMLAEIPVGAPTTTGVFYVGASVALEQALGLWLSNGNADAALVLAEFLHITPAVFAERATARAQVLLLDTTSITSLIATADFGTTTLYDTGVLLCRALAEPSIASLLSIAASTSFVKVAGETPVVWFASATMRASALKVGDTTHFLILTGEGIATGAENTFFAPVVGGVA